MKTKPNQIYPLGYLSLDIIISSFELFVEVLRSVSECPNPTVNLTSLPSLLNENILFPENDAGLEKIHMNTVVVYG